MLQHSPKYLHACNTAHAIAIATKKTTSNRTETLIVKPAMQSWAWTKTPSSGIGTSKMLNPRYGLKWRKVKIAWLISHGGASSVKKTTTDRIPDWKGTFQLALKWKFAWILDLLMIGAQILPVCTRKHENARISHEYWDIQTEKRPK